MCANGVGRQSGRKDMSKTKVALNPRLRLEVFHVTVKRPSKVGQRKVRSLVRNRNSEQGSKGSEQRVSYVSSKKANKIDKIKQKIK